MNRNSLLLVSALLAILASCCLNLAAAQVTKCKSGETSKSVFISHYSFKANPDGSESSFYINMEQLYDVRRMGPGANGLQPAFTVGLYSNTYDPTTYEDISSISAGVAYYGEPIECVSRAGPVFKANCSVPAYVYVYDNPGWWGVGTLSIQFQITGKQTASSSYTISSRTAFMATTPPTIDSNSVRYLTDQYTCENDKACTIKVEVKNGDGEVLLSETVNDAYMSAGFKPRDRSMSNSPYGCYF